MMAPATTKIGKQQSRVRPSKRAYVPKRKHKDAVTASINAGDTVSSGTSATSIATPDSRQIVGRNVTTGYASASPSTITVDAVSQVAQEIEIDRNNKTAITQYIAQTIFPHLKFLDNRQFGLGYSVDPKSICSLVMLQCFRGKSMSQLWWENKGKKHVRSAMSRVRSDRMQAVKKAFNGKSRW